MGLRAIENVRVFLKFILCICYIGHLQAQEPLFLSEANLVSESLYFEDIPIVATATRMKQTRTQTPVSVTIISQEDIKASGFVEIADLLRLVPGFQVAHSGSRIFTATYHGQTGQFSNRLQVLIDGRSVYLPLFSSVDWSMLGVQIDDIDRIEVIRGPNAPAYGANAFLGTVNIITRAPVSDSGNFAATRVGTPDLRTLSLRHSDSLGDIDYRVSATYRENSGYKSIYDDVAVSEFNFRGTYYATTKDEIDIKLGSAKGHNGVSGEGDNFTPDHKRESDSNFKQIVWHHVLSDRSDISVQFYHNYYRHNDEYDIGLLSDVFTELLATPVSPANVPAVLSGLLGLTPENDQVLKFALHHGTAERYDLEAQHVILLENGHQFAWGIGTRLDQLQSYIYLGHDQVVEDSSTRAFFNGQVLLNDEWTANIGLMIEKGDIVDTQYSPRLALNWAFEKGHVVRISTTQAHRNPSLLDANWNWAARTEGGQVLSQRYITLGKMESETIRSYELGYAVELPDAKSFMEIKLFREEIRDAIATRQDKAFAGDPIDNETLVAGNNGYSNINGVEGQLSYRPSKRSFVNFQYSVTRTTAEKSQRVHITVIRNQSDSTPARTFSLLAAYGLPHQIDASLGYYHISDMEWLGDGDALPGYTRVDVRIAKKLSILQQDSEIAFVVQNLGHRYSEFIKENEFETRGYLMLEMNL